MFCAFFFVEFADGFLVIAGQMPEADGDEIMQHLKDFNMEFDLVMAKVSINYLAQDHNFVDIF